MLPPSLVGSACTVAVQPTERAHRGCVEEAMDGAGGSQRLLAACEPCRGARLIMLQPAGHLRHQSCNRDTLWQLVQSSSLCQQVGVCWRLARSAAESAIPRAGDLEVQEEHGLLPHQLWHLCAADDGRLHGAQPQQPGGAGPAIGSLVLPFRLSAGVHHHRRPPLQVRQSKMRQRVQQIRWRVSRCCAHT